MLVDSLKPATERALLQSIVLLQYFPELISSNHAREAFKALSSLAKDTRLVGSRDRKLKMFFAHSIYILFNNALLFFYRGIFFFQL